MRELPTVYEAATLLALCVKRKEEDLGKEMSRHRMSEKTMRLITGRRRLDGRFVNDLNEALEDFNLTLAVTSDAIGVIKASAVLGFPRLNSSRIAAELRLARRGKLEYSKLTGELKPDGSDFELEESDD